MGTGLQQRGGCLLSCDGRGPRLVVCGGLPVAFASCFIGRALSKRQERNRH